MRRYGRLIVVCALSLAAAGCGMPDQSRMPRSGSLDRETLDRSIHRHGRGGLEVERYFNSPAVKERMDPLLGRSLGYMLTEFFTVRIARDPTRRDLLSLVGYVTRMQEERRGESLYEFYDSDWSRVAWMNPRGELFGYGARAGEKVHHGNFDFEDAARVIFQPRSGYGYDAEKPDLSRMRAFDPEVMGDTPRGRGIILRQHRGNEPRIEVRPADSTELFKLRRELEAHRFNARADAELEEWRKYIRGENVNGPVGGIMFQDGQPVDDQGRPIRRGDKYIGPDR